MFSPSNKNRKEQNCGLYLCYHLPYRCARGGIYPQLWDHPFHLYSSTLLCSTLICYKYSLQLMLKWTQWGASLMILLLLAPAKITHESLLFLIRPSFIDCVLQEIRNMHNEQLMGIRREEEMEMSDDDMEDSPDSKDSEDSGICICMRVLAALSARHATHDIHWSRSSQDERRER